MKSKDSARQPILPFDGSGAEAPPRAEIPPALATPPAPVPVAHASSPAPAKAMTPSELPALAGTPAPSETARPRPFPRSASAPGETRVESYLPEALLLLAAIVVLGIGLSAVPLLDPDEARYASASRSMLERNDLVVPYFNGVERLNKPALFYWLQVSSFRLFGATAAAARIPSALAALALLASVMLFARRAFGARAARYTGLILLTLPLFAVVGKTGITDMTLALFTVGAMLLWYSLHIGEGGETSAAPAGVAERPSGTGHSAAALGGRATEWRRRLLWLGVSLCLGLAFFVKGPVGILVPCFVITCYLLIRREWSGFRLRGILLGAVVALAVFLPWAGMLVHRLGAEFVHAGAAAAAGAGTGFSSVMLAGMGRVTELLRHETIDRTLHGLDHPEPLPYYWVASLVVFFPWIAWVPSVIARNLPRIRRLEPATLFLVTWLFGILVFFTAIRGKLLTYILPATPAIALLLGREWARHRDGRVDSDGHAELSSTRWITIGSILLVAGVIIFVGYAAVAPPAWLEGHFALADGLALVLALAAALPLLLRRPGAVFVSVAGVMAATLVAVPVVAGRDTGEKRSLASLTREVGFRERTWTRVIAYKSFRPSLIFYGGRDVMYIDTGRKLHEALVPGCLIVLEQRHFDDLPPAWQSALRTVATQGDVLAMTPVTMFPKRNRSAGGVGPRRPAAGVGGAAVSGGAAGSGGAAVDSGKTGGSGRSDDAPGSGADHSAP